jgi:hypothetical protein
VFVTAHSVKGRRASQVLGPGRTAGAWVAGRGGVALFHVHFGRVRAVSVPDLELGQAGVRAPVTCTINHILKILTHKESSKGVSIQQGSFTFAADAFDWCSHGQSWYFHGLWQVVAHRLPPTPQIAGWAPRGPFGRF